MNAAGYLQLSGIHWIAAVEFESIHARWRLPLQVLEEEEGDEMFDSRAEWEAEVGLEAAARAIASPETSSCSAVQGHSEVKLGSLSCSDLRGLGAEDLLVICMSSIISSIRSGEMGLLSSAGANDLSLPSKSELS